MHRLSEIPHRIRLASRSFGIGPARRPLRFAALAATLLLIGSHVIPLHSEETASQEPRIPPPPAGAGPVIPETDRETSSETVMEGDRFEMIAHEHELHFFVTGNVRVTGNNIVLTCDRLEGISSRSDEEVRTGERLGGMGRIRNMVAIGNVYVHQEGREAFAGRAEVLPDEGRVILTESPVIRDAQGEVSGERIILYQGLERAVVESSPERPARIILPTLPDLGFPGNDQREEDEHDEAE